MSKNHNLTAAKKAKNDEFYTRREDIEAELMHYADHFRGKVVYCNCDDPESSEFWKFFMRVFAPWGLKKLIATHYEPNAENFSYMITAEPAPDGSFSYLQKPVLTRLPCNGDFRSAACIERLKEADIVVTNPPFSLFRELDAALAAEEGSDQYIVQLYENHAEVLTASHSKEDTAAFLHAQGIEEADMRYQSGVMGVPITFLDKYCPEQFEIVGTDFDFAQKIDLGNGRFGTGRFYVGGAENLKRLYSRLIIKHRGFDSL